MLKKKFRGNDLFFPWKQEHSKKKYTQTESKCSLFSSLTKERWGRVYYHNKVLKHDMKLVMFQHSLNTRRKSLAGGWDLAALQNQTARI